DETDLKRESTLPITRIEDKLADVDKMIVRLESRLRQEERAAATARERVDRPFEQAAELETAERRSKLIAAIIKEQSRTVGSEDAAKDKRNRMEALEHQLREARLAAGEEAADVDDPAAEQDTDLLPRTPAAPSVSTDEKGRPRITWPDVEARKAAKERKKREKQQRAREDRGETTLDPNQVRSDLEGLREDAPAAGNDDQEQTEEETTAPAPEQQEPVDSTSGDVTLNPETVRSELDDLQPDASADETEPAEGETAAQAAPEGDSGGPESETEAPQTTEEPVEPEAPQTTEEPEETPPASQAVDAPAGAPDVELPDGQRWVHRDDVRPGDVVRFYRDGEFSRVAALVKNTRAPHHLDYANVDRRFESLGSWSDRVEWVAVVDKGPDRTAGNRYVKHYGEYMRNQLAENLQRWEAARRESESEETTPEAPEKPEAGRDETSSDSDEQQSTDAEPQTQKDDAQADTQAPSGAAPSPGQRATDSAASPSRAPRARTGGDDATNDSGAPRAQRPAGERAPRPAPTARPEPEPQPAPADMSTEQLGDAIDDVEDQLSPLTESTDPLDLAMRRRLELRLWELENEERRRWKPEPTYDDNGRPVQPSRGDTVQDRLGGYGLNDAEVQGLVTRVDDLPEAKDGGYSDEEWERINAEASAREDYPPTDEQNIIIQGAARRGLNMAVMALAGTGKSSTLKMLSHRMPGKKIVYLAFNRSVAAEAREAQARGEYAKNMLASTANAYAARVADRRINDRLPSNRAGGFKKLSAQQIADRMRWHDTVKAGNRDLTPGGAATVAERMIREWAKSADAEMGPQHIKANIEGDPRDLFNA
ncbi:hypothetical protein ACFUC2_30535, partial [[Kitasatospora] papulosa]|uniref:hypothetical protein n=1 Tax=[Kitasatospora] papulosa TaxID=1464011 RepID=UPI0036432DB1